MSKMLRTAALGAATAALASAAWGQSNLVASAAMPTASPAITRPMPAPASVQSFGPLSHVAIGVKVGVLGGGLEVATPLTARTNFRIGGNYLNFTDNLTTSGVNYQVGLKFASAETSVDWFPWGRSFHISPGALVYDANRVTAKGSVPAGTSFTINGADYVSSATDPVGGSANIGFAHAAPKLTIGWGNMIPRSGRHFSFPFEVGFAYVGDPKVNLNFAGSACDSTGVYCQPVATTPSIQQNVDAERQKFQNDANYARFFPLLSMGYSYRF